MRRALLCSCAILAVNGFTAAYAAGSQDAAYDKNAKTVSDSFGHCVRTKWSDASDPCGTKQPAAKPAPASIAKAEPMPEISLEQRTVYFDFNSAKLTAEGITKLDQLATIINEASGISDVRIHGFTDQLGTAGYNSTLANKRAAAVKAYLDSKSRLRSSVGEVRGLGKSAPEAGCASKARAEKIACMATERRVEIELKAQK